MSQRPEAYDKDKAHEHLGRYFEDSAKLKDPHSMLAWFRENEPMPQCNGLNLALGYKDVATLYRSPLVSRHIMALREAEAHSSDDSKADPVAADAQKAQVLMLINQDDPEHSRIRKILEYAFRLDAVQSWIPNMQAITDRLIDNVMEKDEFNFTKDVAYPLPEQIICDLLGVPHSDHDKWSAWSETIVGSARTKEPTPETAHAVADAVRNYYLYLEDLVAKRKQNLGDDLVSSLIKAQVDGERLSDLELIGTVQMLISAGHETTANLINTGMWLLITHDDQYELLRSDPDRVPAAIEEMLRYESPAQLSLPRVTTGDVELSDGRKLAAGCPVILSNHAPNRDPQIFENPNKFDVTRQRNRHVAFAAGPHFCLGSAFARYEAQIMFKAIITRLPKLALVDHPKWRTTFVRALESYRVRKVK